jgi:precorrin-6Y C5,15-methyltransferase (decarboxylating)
MKYAAGRTGEWSSTVLVCLLSVPYRVTATSPPMVLKPAWATPERPLTDQRAAGPGAGWRWSRRQAGRYGRHVTGGDEELIRLAFTRLRWDAADAEIVAGRIGTKGDGAQPIAVLHPTIQPDRRVLAVAADSAVPAAICELLVARGYGGSEVRILHGLGEQTERMLAGSAARWMYPPAPAPLVLALRCHPGPDAPLLTRTPGLPAAGYPTATRGLLPSPEVRAVIAAALAPVPGQLLWDVGAAAGSAGIEWMRTAPACRAVAIERDPDRADQIARASTELGVPALRVIRGAAPGVLRQLIADGPPNAIFLGCASDRAADRILETCWPYLPPGARLAATATAPAGIAALTRWYAHHGGTLRRLTLSNPSATGAPWQEAAAVALWSTTRTA